MIRFTALFTVLAFLALPTLSHAAGEEEWRAFGEPEALSAIAITIASSGTTATATITDGKIITDYSGAVTITGCTGDAGDVAAYCTDGPFIITDVDGTDFTYTIVDVDDDAAAGTIVVNRTSTAVNTMKPQRVLTTTLDEASDFSAVINRNKECLNIAFIQEDAMINSLDTCYTSNPATCNDVEGIRTAAALDHILIFEKPWENMRIQNEASGTGLVHAFCYGNGN